MRRSKRRRALQGFEGCTLDDLLQMQAEAALASLSSPWPADALRDLADAIAARRAENLPEPMRLTLGNAEAIVEATPE
jgi:hypothetical protein